MNNSFLTRVFLLFTLVVSPLFYTQAAQEQPMSSIDLKITMKNMRLEFTKAMDAPTSDVFKKHITEIQTLLGQAKQYSFSPERKASSLEGLNKVDSVLTHIQSAPITEANLTAAKAQLEDVDALRKEYHKKTKPSVWDLIFG